MPYEILIVEDDPHTRDLVAFALQQAGFAVHEAADGLSALARIASLSPDLVVLDVAWTAARVIASTSQVTAAAREGLA